MNSQSGKFGSLMLGKLVSCVRVHPYSLKIGGAVNLTRYEFSEFRIHRAGTLPTGNCGWRGFGPERGQAGNLSRFEFPALKIEIVENGSIRQ